MSAAEWSEQALRYFEAHAIDPRIAAAMEVREQAGVLVYPYEPREGARFERRRPLKGSATYQPPGVPLAPWWPLGVPYSARHSATFALACEGEADTLAVLSVLASRNGDAGARRFLADARLEVAAIPGTGYPAERLADELVAAGTREAWLAFDADLAGDTYAAKAAEALQAVGILPRRVVLPEGRDLADCLAAAEDRTEWLANVLAVAQEPEHDGDAEPWPPLASSPPLPSFPVEAVPPVLGDWIKATSEATQTPLDLAACAALGVLSAAVSGAGVVEVEPGWCEECCLYVVCALESGERKSAVLRDGTAPLRAIERERIEQARPLVAEARTRREIREQRLRRLTAELARTDDAAKSGEAGTLAAELAAEPEPRVPRLLADDATPEALAGLLARYGRMAILAAESAFLDNLAGRYAEGRSNLHLVCQAYSGEPTTIDRRSRDPEVLERPLLTLALIVQPHVLAALIASPVARAQGFVARCLLARPRPRLGHRQVHAAPVPESIMRAWAQTVERLAERPGHADTTDTTDQPQRAAGVPSVVSRVLGLSHDAHGLLASLRAEHEPHLREDGDLHPIADWHSRHAGRLVRIAGLLHLAGEEPGDTIGADTMRRALMIGEWSLAHALDALIGPDHGLRRALAWLRRHGQPEVSVRDLQRSMSGNATSEEAQALAGRLETHGALRALEPAPVGKQGGRPPSPRYAVHPDLVGEPDAHYAGH